MSAPPITRPQVLVRDAERRDNDALKEIAASSPMAGDMTIAVTREPDFFQLNRLEGSRWRVGVAEVDGGVVGCVMGAEREAYLHGVARRTLYAGDLKVHPTMRGAGVADALSRWVADAVLEMGGPGAPVLLTILSGNRAMERRTTGRGGMANFTRFATIRAFSIPLLLPRVVGTSDVRVVPATNSDIEEMVDLWSRVAPGRQFAPVFTADGFRDWVASAPELDISDYRLARDRTGRLVGFLAWWDQLRFKQLRVLRHSPRLGVARAMLNAMARLTGGVSLPAAGEVLRYRTALHVCVRDGSPAILRTLVRSSCAELRAARYAFATIGLDIRDPLCAALDGLFAQPTGSHAHICTTSGDYLGPSLGDRPLHYEIALV